MHNIKDLVYIFWHSQKTASQRCRLQRSSCHLWRRPGLLEEGTYPLARRLLLGRTIGEIIWSLAPNKVLLTVPPPVDPAEELQPRSYRSALSQLQSYCHSVGRADDPTCPDCQRRRPHGGPPLQLFHTSNGSGIGGYVGGTPLGSPIAGGLPGVCRSAPTADRLRLPSSLTFIPAVGPLPLAAPEGPLHLHRPLLLISYHLIRGAEVVLPPNPPPPSPLSNNSLLHECKKVCPSTKSLPQSGIRAWIK